MDKKQRLLDVITPKIYTIALKPNLEAFTFSGEEVIDISLIKTTKSITLHAVALKVTKAVLQDNKKGIEAKVSYDTEAKTVTFTFPEEIQTGEKKLAIIFTGIINEALQGWYKSGYEVNGEKRYLATSHFEEIGARQVFPCIDDPAAKAIFIFTLTIAKGLTAISNTIPVHIEDKENTQIIEFAPTPKMSTYPLVLIVGEFESVETKTENGIAVRIFATPGKKHLTEFALTTAAKMIQFYEKYFDIPYPLPKLDFIAIPDFDAGAMENWGAVTAREVAILIDEKKSAATNKQWVATVIAHEISHMWFGDLVTLEWWTYLWLNEGFASYMEYMALDEFFPEWHVWEQFAVLDHNRALEMDSLKNTHPIETEVTDLNRLPENFDEISYSKGASVIYMLAAFLGKENFQKGVQIYLKKYAYGNATTEELWGALEEASGQPVEKIMHEFIKESGHPIISVEEKNEKLLLTQQRFFMNPFLRKKFSENPIWKIPFTVASSDVFYPKEYVMEDKTLALPIPKNDTWIKVNAAESSFVRVIYPKSLYTQLEKPLEEGVLSPVDRMGIVRDAFDGAEAGLLSTDFALQLARSYRKETSYIVWVALIGRLAKIANILSLTELLPLFDTYAIDLLTLIGEKLGVEKQPQDVYNDILLRSIVFYSRGKYGDKRIREKARQLFSDYTESGKAIDNDLRGGVYRLVAENGGEKEFDIFKKMYKEESLHEEKNRIGNALVSFKDPQLVRKALTFALSKDVRIQDIGRFIMLGFDNELGNEITWEFVKENWSYLMKKHEGQIGVSWLIEGAANFTSQKLRDDFENFFTQHPTPQLIRTIQQVLEKIQSNIAWLERDREAVSAFLKSQKSKKT